jgi:hypothetical protein
VLICSWGMSFGFLSLKTLAVGLSKYIAKIENHSITSRERSGAVQLSGGLPRSKRAAGLRGGTGGCAQSGTTRAAAFQGTAESHDLECEAPLKRTS